MIILPEVVTAGGTSEFVFELTDSKRNRLANISPGVATVSLRRGMTARINHELTHLPAHLDAVDAVVTLQLSKDQTRHLAPPIDTTPAQVETKIIGDVRIVDSTDTNYFGPFMFGIRLPETYDGQAVPVLSLTVVGGLSDDNAPDTAELTISQVGNRLPFPAHIDQYQLIWRLATEPDLTSLVVASDPTSLNQISAFTLWPDEVALTDGRAGKVLVSNQSLTSPIDTWVVA